MQKKSINLALQGGGAHGAFTWGVLERLLEEEALEIAAMSGTSAGALNGAALKAGWVNQGRDGARAALNALWGQVKSAPAAALHPWISLATPAQISQSLEYSPAYLWGEAISRMVSPYTWGPLYNNPLEPIVRDFDYECVCADPGPAFFVCATRVRNGKLRVFSGQDICADAIMASACLPTLFQAVEMHDTETGRLEAFWDGGYSGNPALFPLFNRAFPDDIVIVNINPLERDEIPKTPQQIQNRINEISFNSSLLRELRAIDFVQRLLEDGTLPEGRMARVLVHMIADDALMTDLSVATKVVPNAQIIDTLKQSGRRAATQFLRDHWASLNVESSVSLRQMFN